MASRRWTLLVAAIIIFAVLLLVATNRTAEQSGRSVGAAIVGHPQEAAPPRALETPSPGALTSSDAPSELNGSTHWPLQGPQRRTAPFQLFPGDGCECRYNINYTAAFAVKPNTSPLATISALIRELADPRLARNGTRVLFLGDSLARYTFTAMGSAAANARLLGDDLQHELNDVAKQLGLHTSAQQAATASSTNESLVCDARGGGAHILCNDPEEGKSIIVHHWPKLDALLASPSIVGAKKARRAAERILSTAAAAADIQTRESTLVPDEAKAKLPLLLRSEMDSYLDATWNYTWSGARGFDPTHIVVSRALWDSFRQHPHNPRRFLLEFSEGLVTLRNAFAPTVRIFVYGLHKMFPRKVFQGHWNCLTSTSEAHTYREAGYCAVQRANRHIASAAAAKGGRTYPGGWPIHYLDTMSVTARFTLGHTNGEDGRHFRGPPMDNVLAHVLEEMVGVERYERRGKAATEAESARREDRGAPANEADGGMPQRSASSMQSFSEKCERAVSADSGEAAATECAALFDLDLKLHQRFVGEKLQQVTAAARELTKMVPSAATAGRSLFPPMRDVRERVVDLTTPRLELPLSNTDDAFLATLAVAATTCSSLLTEIREVFGGVQTVEATWRKRQQSGSVGNARNEPDEASYHHPLPWPAYQAAKSCLELINTAVTNAYFHAYLWPRTVPAMLYECLHVKLLPLYQLPNATDPVFLDFLLVEKGCVQVGLQSYLVDTMRTYVQQYQSKELGVVVCPHLLHQGVSMLSAASQRLPASPMNKSETFVFFVERCTADINAMNATQFQASWSWSKYNQCGVLRAVHHALTQRNRELHHTKQLLKRLQCHKKLNLKKGKP